jgi:hypothetical protein
MKKSKLRELIREIITQHPIHKDINNKLMQIANREIEQGKEERYVGDPKKGHEIMNQADQENVARILRGEKPIRKENVQDLYSKEQAIQYIENNPNAKYYKIGVGKGVQQNFRGADQAIKGVESSAIDQFELDTYGDVIAFSAPFDEKHGAAVTAMGGLD